MIASDEVLAWLDDTQRALLRSGELIDQPEYQCLRCGVWGDTRRDRTALVVFAHEHGNGVLGLVHAACGSSRVHTQTEAEQWVRQAQGSVQDRADEVITTCVEIDGERYATVIVVPIDGATVWPDGAVHPVDLCVTRMIREHQFVRVGLPGPVPAARLRWAVRVRQGHLAAITRPGGTWWSADDRPFLLDEPWVNAARRTRRVLLLVTGARIVEDDGDDAAFRAGLLSAAGQGRLAGALVSVNGIKPPRAGAPHRPSR